MFKKLGTPFLFLIALVLAPFVGGCGDDDNPTDMGGDMTKDFTVTIENVGQTFDFFGSGVFNTPVGASSASPAFPGQAFEFRIGAVMGDHLSFATMFAQSNDLFYGPNGNGIALFDAGGVPVSGDVTDQVHLWDAGTEMNEEPGAGMNQAPRQSGANTGPADSNTSVRMVSDGYTYPNVSDVIRVTITPEGGNEFRVRIENVSTEGMLVTSANDMVSIPLSPGVYVVHASADPLFTSGAADFGDGLEHIAEDGNPGSLGPALAARTGLTTPLAPGVYTVGTAVTPLFEENAADAGHGLEGLAEDASPTALASYATGLSGVSTSGTFTMPDGASSAGPIFPGHSFTITFTASKGDRLAFANMFGQSNDLFYGFNEDGLALFDGGGNAVTGDVTSMVHLWDAGTEANQWPGAGPDQAPRQSGPNTGAADPTDMVRRVNDGYAYPDVADIIRVTVSVTN